ncbi:ABC transporter substrate-binding protein [Pseudomonas sp. PA27(2017)]|uniref:ABC transporter substrate-binding protein n=1 Tax=Pseudomonas sp. PA27(2017) TaxID=1932112 RepID=UPI0009600B9C|nr:ABC transporter substrate-binding protein [Pseudomonas sp. PA27(2017)]OLU35910.1 ABC transporter substrate-binding protein [Pseudomonas sp. PA27(2017)]
MTDHRPHASARCRAWLRRALVVLCLLTPAAQAADLLLSTAGDTTTLQQFGSALAAARPADRVRIVPLNEMPPLEQMPGNTRLILFGQSALAWRLESSYGPPTLVLQVNKTQAHETLGGRQPANLSVLWQDPAPHRQLRLLKHLLPSAKRVGVLHDPHSEFLIPELRQAASELGLQIVAQAWPDTRDNNPVIRLLGASDVLLAVADDDLYNPLTAKTLLLTSYGQQHALIGPSAGFVRAGSLASTYGDQNDWLVTLDRVLDQAPAQWPAGIYSNTFKVLGNPQVARTLGITLPSDAELARHLSQGDTP